MPVVLANARMSEKSARGYAAGHAGTPAFASLSAVCAQSEADAQRLRARRDAVQVQGNLQVRRDAEPQQLAAGRAWRQSLGRPVLLLASTRKAKRSSC